MTKKELLKAPMRKRGEELKDIFGVYLMPTKRKHESGYLCIEFVARMGDERTLIKGGIDCDVIKFDGEHFIMDCEPKTGCLHIWNSRGFSITDECSSIYFEENKRQ